MVKFIGIEVINVQIIVRKPLLGLITNKIPPVIIDTTINITRVNQSRSSNVNGLVATDIVEVGIIIGIIIIGLF